jgi:hypothetical protein
MGDFPESKFIFLFFRETCHTSIIPALRKLRQGDYVFKANLDYVMRPCHFRVLLQREATLEFESGFFQTGMCVLEPLESELNSCCLERKSYN